MFPFNIKFAAIACVLVAFIAFAMHYDHLKEKVELQEIAIKAHEQKAAEIERVANEFHFVRFCHITTLISDTMADGES